MLHYDLIDLKVFALVCELGSLTRAARRVHLSTPAVSLRIRQLEDRLGTQLLVRQARGVEPTAAGQALWRRALQVSGVLECLHGDLMPFAAGAKGTVRLLANTIATSTFVPVALGRFLERHPQVDVDAEEMSSEDVAVAVAAGRADLGIVAGPRADPSLQSLLLLEDQLVAVLPAAGSAAAPRTIAFDALWRAHRFVALGRSSSFHAFLEARAEEKGGQLQARTRVGSFDAMLRMVAAGVGVAVVPNSLFRQRPVPAGLHVLPLSDEWARRGMYLLWLEQRELPGFARELVDDLAAAAALVAAPKVRQARPARQTRPTRRAGRAER